MGSACLRARAGSYDAGLTWHANGMRAHGTREIPHGRPRGTSRASHELSVCEVPSAVPRTPWAFPHSHETPVECPWDVPSEVPSMIKTRKLLTSSVSASPRQRSISLCRSAVSVACPTPWISGPQRSPPKRSTHPLMVFRNKSGMKRRSAPVADHLF